MFDNLEKAMLQIVGQYEPASLEERVQMLVDKLTRAFKNPDLGFDVDNAEYHSRGRYLVRKKSPVDVLELKLVGSGYFSKVYDAGNGLIVKVTNDEVDTAYDNFAKFCMQNDSKHLPKIYWRGEFDGHSAYVMEKLRPYEGEMRTAMSSLLRMKLMQLGADRASREGHCDTSTLDSLVNPTLFGPDLAIAATSLVQEFDNLARGSDYIRWDLHGDNAMQREDGTPVFTDPWAAE
tara:strand:- start:438 stop:1139 length:702 start_codon:yes stop_codon:yes gene_type:complete